MQPSTLTSDGSSYLYKFTDVFSKDEFVGQATGSTSGQWVSLSVDISGSQYTIRSNESTLPLDGGTYELQIFDVADFGAQWDTEDENWEVSNVGWDDAFAALSVYGTEIRKWSQLGNTWSSVPGIPTQEGNSIMTTRAWVSESIADTKFISTNENAAYVVYEG